MWVHRETEKINHPSGRSDTGWDLQTTILFISLIYLKVTDGVPDFPKTCVSLRKLEWSIGNSFKVFSFSKYSGFQSIPLFLLFYINSETKEVSCFSMTHCRNTVRTKILDPYASTSDPRRKSLKVQIHPLVCICVW